MQKAAEVNGNKSKKKVLFSQQAATGERAIHNGHRGVVFAVSHEWKSLYDAGSYLLTYQVLYILLPIHYVLTWRKITPPVYGNRTTVIVPLWYPWAVYTFSGVLFVPGIFFSVGWCFNRIFFRFFIIMGVIKTDAVRWFAYNVRVWYAHKKLATD